MSIPKKLLAPAVISFAYSLLPCAALAQIESPVPLSPERFRWLSPPNNPALQYAWLLGNEPKHGPYILRVKLSAGGRIPPHTHPDERISTVLSGTIYVGFGKTFDEAKVVAIPAGAVCIIPANVPHYLWVKDGDAIYQESGYRPDGNIIHQALGTPHSEGTLGFPAERVAEFATKGCRSQLAQRA